jgi:hypothetical protein
MEKKLANVQEAMYSLVASCELLTVTSGYGVRAFFIKNGSLILKGCAGLDVHQIGVVGFGHTIPSPAGVFTAELSALFTALRHIAGVIQPPEICLILTDRTALGAEHIKKLTHFNHRFCYQKICCIKIFGHFELLRQIFFQNR